MAMPENLNIGRPREKNVTGEGATVSKHGPGISPKFQSVKELISYCLSKRIGMNSMITNNIGIKLDDGELYRIGNMQDFFDTLSSYVDKIVLKYDSTGETVFKGDYIELLVRNLRKCGIECEDTDTYDLSVEQAVKEFQNRYMKDNFWYSSAAGDNKVVKGVVDDLTLQQIFSYANDMPDYIDPEDGSYNGREFGSNNSSTDYGFTDYYHTHDPTQTPTQTPDTPNDYGFNDYYYTHDPTQTPVKPSEDNGDSAASDSSPHYQPFFNKENEKQFRQNHRDIRIIFGNSGIIKTIHDVVIRSVGVDVDTSGNPISETFEFIARDVTETDEARDKGKYQLENGVSPSDIQYKFNFNFDN